MSVTNPFSITFDGVEIGGTSSAYQLFGPYIINRAYDTIQVAADVVVVAETIASLQALCETLESAFSKRLVDDDTLVLDMDGSAWTYTAGKTILAVTSTITKSGNPDLDKAFSRGYTVTITGQLPASDEDDGGLRDIETFVDFEATRQKMVSFRGIYTATEDGNAKANYATNADGVCLDLLGVVSGTATWELVDETYTLDREGAGTGSGIAHSPHVLTFTRQYIELLANQSQSALNDGQIKDHRITFTDLGSYPGDSTEDATRLRRVMGNYDCAVDTESTTNLQSVFASKIKNHIRALFQSNFNPSQFAVEEERISYDETSKRISVTFQFVYQTQSGERLVEIQQSMTYREARNIIYTPTHEDDEFAYEADPGFATFERVWTRTAVGIGAFAPNNRILKKAGGSNTIGPFSDTIGGVQGVDHRETDKVQKEGWNVISNTSQVTPRHLGSPDGAQRIEVTILNETVVERFHRKPGQRTTASIPTGPITG
tara:strand:- start:18190 stop:19653 length:1464 start_codon:yes stop_codon:yes gene_type:complete